jgi:transmembrane sensor
MNAAGKQPEQYQIEDFVTDESFINYFLRLNTEDTSYWTKWLITHPENVQLAESAIEMLQSLSLTLTEGEFEIEMEKMRAAIGIRTGTELPSVVRLLDWRGEGKRRGRKRAVRTLSVVLLIVAACALVWQLIPPGAGRLKEKFNDSGKPEVFTLNDGTVVTLAPQGVFRYPADFGAGDRKVFLDGEAQFQVSRDEAHPFQVVEGDIVATVLGTVFNVKGQAADPTVMVELIKGRLRVETIARVGVSAQSVMLNPDERVVYPGNGQKMTKEKWQSQLDLPMPENHLVFRKSNFEEVAAQIKKVFGVTVINEATKKDWRFTGEFKGSTAAEIVENVCLVEGLKSEVQGDTIVIR